MKSARASLILRGRRIALRNGGWGLGIGLALILIACSLSRPGAPPGSKGPPTFLLKFVSYSQNDALMGYFSLADAATNQVAAAGQLRIQIYTTAGLSVGDSGGAMRWKRSIYNNTYAIGVTNFHWEQFGSFVTVKELICRFMVPYEHFQSPVKRGKVVTVEINFCPDGATGGFTAKQNVSLY